MSTSLVRKGLEIVDPDCFTTGKLPSNKNKLSQKKGKKNQQVKSLQFCGKVRSTKKSKAGNQSIETIRKHLAQVDDDKTDENIRRLQLLSSTSVDQVTANKILERAGKIKKNIVKEEQKDEKTVFTEEDFEAFEKEYFVG